MRCIIMACLAMLISCEAQADEPAVVLDPTADAVMCTAYFADMAAFQLKSGNIKEYDAFNAKTIMLAPTAAAMDALANHADMARTLLTVQDLERLMRSAINSKQSAKRYTDMFGALCAEIDAQMKRTRGD